MQEMDLQTCSSSLLPGRAEINHQAPPDPKTEPQEPTLQSMPTGPAFCQLPMSFPSHNLPPQKLLSLCLVIASQTASLLSRRCANPRPTTGYSSLEHPACVPYTCCEDVDALLASCQLLILQKGSRNNKPFPPLQHSNLTLFHAVHTVHFRKLLSIQYGNCPFMATL